MVLWLPLLFWSSCDDATIVLLAAAATPGASFSTTHAAVFSNPAIGAWVIVNSNVSSKKGLWPGFSFRTNLPYGLVSSRPHSASDVWKLT